MKGTGFLADPVATHLMFIDADIAFQPEQALRLLAFDKDVVAAAYPLKGIDWQGATKAALAGRPPQSAALEYVVGWAEPERIAGQQGFARVRYAGTGVHPNTPASARAALQRASGTEISPSEQCK